MRTKLRRGRRTSPTWSFIYGVGLVAVAVVLGLVTVSYHHGAMVSARVQAHGVSDVINVEFVDYTESYNRETGSHYTTTWRGPLSTPVDGVQMTTVHLRGKAPTAEGSRHRVLVDPDNGAYAEIPGSAYVRSYQWILALVGTVAVTILAAYFFVTGVRKLRRRRRAVTA